MEKENYTNEDKNCAHCGGNLSDNASADRKNITTKEAEEVWERLKHNILVSNFYPTFEDYWKECERINNLSDDEWHALVAENQKTIANVKTR